MCNNIPLVAATKFCGTLFSTKSNGDVASDTVCGQYGEKYLEKIEQP